MGDAATSHQSRKLQALKLQHDHVLALSTCPDANATMASRHVSHDNASTFMKRCFANPSRMRLLCSKKAGREGGECLAVSVEIASAGPVVEVQETSMAEGRGMPKRDQWI